MALEEAALNFFALPTLNWAFIISGKITIFQFRKFWKLAEKYSLEQSKSIKSNISWMEVFLRSFWFYLKQKLDCLNL